MSAGGGRPALDALALHAEDDVATALRPLDAGEVARVGRPDGTRIEVAVADDVPLCHKLALRALAAGEPVRKYGEVIGEATADVEPGGWVHVHNLASRRARRRGDEA